ncbi:MAG: PP2C family protein-serine/threonine phosphatase [Acidobacteriota bacterium]
MSRNLGGWLILGVLGLLTLGWATPRIFPLNPELSVTRLEARTLALELLRDLGPPPGEGAYVVQDLEINRPLEGRLQQLSRSPSPLTPAEDQAVPITGWLKSWRLLVYESGASVNDWLYAAQIGTDGEILTLQRRVGEAELDPGATEALEQETAEKRAWSYLMSLGLDAGLAPTAEVRRVDPAGETGATVTFVRWRFEQQPPGGLAYGREVVFEGQQLRGVAAWFDDPRQEELRDSFAQIQLSSMLQILMLYLVLPAVLIGFRRLYHRGEFGVARGVRLGLLCLTASALFLLLNAESLSSSVTLGPISRRATTFLTAGFCFFFYFLGLAVTALASWCVGESLCRRKWPEKLAALDALMRGRWDNVTVARSALLAWCGGLAMAGLTAGGAVLLQPLGFRATNGFRLNLGFDSSMPGLSQLLGVVAAALPMVLFIGLLVPSWSIGRLGVRRGLLVSWLAFAPFMPLLVGLPLSGAWILWMAAATLPPVLFWKHDAAAALGAPLLASLLLPASQLIDAAAPSFQLQGWLAVVACTVPLLVGLRHLTGEGPEVVYSFENVPAHVRRIAERERQRLELETAREIQASILPRPPARIGDFEIAHAYLPASEVGGDFFDLRRLEDGRVLVAVGDVAGHGVSSGLVMSMVKAALRVQAEHDPEVPAMMEQLNRLVLGESAPRRLLATLAYGLLDPADGSFTFACAGHPFPYFLAPDGALRELESAAYPLGVRKGCEPRPRREILQPGETLVLYSDGLVEARAEGIEDPFGFPRLERILTESVGLEPSAMRDAVLASLRAFTGGVPQDDDLTLLVIERRGNPRRSGPPAE